MFGEDPLAAASFEAANNFEGGGTRYFAIFIPRHSVEFTLNLFVYQILLLCGLYLTWTMWISQ